MPRYGKGRLRSRQQALSLHPLSVEEALRGAMETGKPPEPVPQNKHAKRTATKRRLTKKVAPQ
jgi:hypothetical protein